MKKYIISIALLSLFSCKESTFTPQPASGSSQLIFVGANQSECLGETSQMSVKADSCASFDSAKVDGEILTVVIKQKAFCNSKFTMNQRITGNNVVLNADDTTTEASRCTCNYNLTYTFTGVKTGLYKIDYFGKVYSNDACYTTTTVTK